MIAEIALFTDDVEAVVAFCEAKDYYWGRSAYILDPDGRLVELR